MKTIFNILAFCLIAASTYAQTKQEVLTAFEHKIKEVVIYAPTYHEYREVCERILSYLEDTEILYSFKATFVQSDEVQIKYRVHPSELKDFFKQLKNTKTYIQA
jgi:hypothetical protein